MPGAVPQAPAHDGKQMKCFADMSKHDDDQTLVQSRSGSAVPSNGNHTLKTHAWNRFTRQQRI
jgi:hypothetical protein